MPSALALAALSAVLLAACGSSAAPQADYSGKTITFGAVLSLSGAGDLFGVQQKQAIDLAVEAVNRAGVNGGRITVDVADDGSDPTISATRTQELIGQQHVLGLVGPTLTIAAAGVHSLAQAKQVPVIAPSETGPHIVGDCPAAGGCSYVFRDSLGDAVAIPAGVKAAVARTHPKTAAILYASDYIPSLEALGAFQQALADNGVSVPAGGTISFSKHDTDFTSTTDAARALKADIWAVSGPATLPGSILAAARAHGYNGPVLGDDTFNNFAVSAAAGKAGMGSLSASGYWYGSADPANQAFVSAYEARYKDSNGKGQIPDEVAAQAYTAVLLLAQAARQADLTFSDTAADRAKLRAALEQVRIATPLGGFSFTAAHDASQPVWINAMDGRGGFVNLTSVAG